MSVDWIKWVYFCVNEFEFGVSDSIFSENGQQKVWSNILMWIISTQIGDLYAALTNLSFCCSIALQDFNLIRKLSFLSATLKSGLRVYVALTDLPRNATATQIGDKNL